MAITTFTRTITAKGQFTLPLALRRRYHLAPGDRLWVTTDGWDLLIYPLRVAGVRFDRAYRRFSVQCTTRDGRTVLGIVGNLTPRRVAHLTQAPGIVEQARQQPEVWVPTPEKRAA